MPAWKPTPEGSSRWFWPIAADFVYNATITGWAQEDLYIAGFYVIDGSFDLSGIGVIKTTAGSTWTEKCRVGVYNSSGGKPSTLLAEFGVIALDVATTGVLAAAGSATLTKNTLYYLALKLDEHDATSPATMAKMQDNGYTGIDNPMGKTVFSTTAFSPLPGWNKSASHGTGALPADLSAATWTEATASTYAPGIVYTGVYLADGADHFGQAEGADDMDSFLLLGV